MFDITNGKIKTALKAVIYGPEGIGKSTFASHFPDPLFIDTEGSTKHLEVKRLPTPSSWSMLLQEVSYIRDNPHLCKTLIIDTADWAEQLCITELCAEKQVKGIEDIGYGKGYVYIAERFGKLLNLAEEVIEKGIHVIFTAHAQMRKFEQPNELGAYDRWELKLQKKTAPLIKEWADLVLFANYQIIVVNIDNQGASKGKNKAQGGRRVMYTSHHPCWDAKNRFGLPPEMDFEYSYIADLFKTDLSQNSIERVSEGVTKIPDLNTPDENKPEMIKTSYEARNEDLYAGIPKALKDLMIQYHVTPREVQEAISMKGYYPADTPIQNYDLDFINDVLVKAWPQVFQFINDNNIVPY